MACTYSSYTPAQYTPVAPVGPTPLTEAHAAIVRQWYAEGKDKGPNHDVLIESSRTPWDAMSPSEREYAGLEGLRIEREFEPPTRK